uniref:Uncharacterized protein n=1 Tax=Candidatus Kentrum sp. FW TaxID=2126338 RepID=A0A450TGI1_9GAMM|nr:MAG: hypothetical protein BECKFW1821C_GA0114237_100928 [Candidatus Kentron sp. FW]
MLFDKADNVGDGLIVGQGFVEGLDVAGIQRWLVLDVKQLHDFVEIGLFRRGIGVSRHDGSPGW